MKKVISFVILLVFPFAVSASHIAGHVDNPALSTPLGQLIVSVFGILNLVIPIVGALALIWFFWGIIQYVLKADNEDKQTEARSYMLYAVIGMFVMFSIWGLVNLVRSTFWPDTRTGSPFNLGQDEIPKVPLLTP